MQQLYLISTSSKKAFIIKNEILRKINAQKMFYKHIIYMYAFLEFT